MKCPKCNERMAVIESRERKNSVVMRVRLCGNCGTRLKIYEKIPTELLEETKEINNGKQD